MAVVCQHEAEQHHREYKNHVPVLVQRGGLPPIQKEKRIKCKGRDQQHRDIVRIPQSPQHLRCLGKVIADQAYIKPEQHQGGSTQQAAAGLCVQDTPPDRYRPGKDENIIQHRAPKAGIRHIKRPHQTAQRIAPATAAAKYRLPSRTFVIAPVLSKKGIVLPFHTIIMTQSALFCNSVEKSSKKFKKTIQMVGTEIVRFLYDEGDKSYSLQGRRLRRAEDRFGRAILCDDERIDNGTETRQTGFPGAKRRP